MPKYVGATRIAVLKSVKKTDEPAKGRRGMLKSISKKFKSPAEAI